MAAKSLGRRQPRRSVFLALVELRLDALKLAGLVAALFPCSLGIGGVGVATGEALAGFAGDALEQVLSSLLALVDVLVEIAAQFQPSQRPGIGIVQAQ